MAMPVYPADLPVLIGELEGLGGDALYPAPRETQFDDGPVRARNETLISETARTIALKLSRDEFVRFVSFTRVDLNNGARWFKAVVRLPSGICAERSCRIKGPVSDKDWGSHSMVNFTLVVRDW